MPRVVAAIRSRARAKQRFLTWEDARFDRSLGITTSGEAEPSELTVRAGEVATGFSYVATPVRLARSWLRALPTAHRDFTFIDMGSGKGRVLALAGRHGFERVVGVEFATELHEAAEANARAAAKRGVRFESRLCDAAEFDFPDHPLVVHFNNPFAESVMARVLESLARAYASKSAPVVVVYQQRTIEEERHATRNLELLDDLRFLSGRSVEPQRWLDRRMLSAFTVRVYESPEAVGLPASR